MFKEILARADAAKSPDIVARARRNLAQVYVRATPPRTAEALGPLRRQGGRPDRAG